MIAASKSASALVELALAVEGVAAIVVGHARVRIDLDRLVVVGDGLVELALGVELKAAIVEGLREARVEPELARRCRRRRGHSRAGGRPRGPSD